MVKNSSKQNTFTTHKALTQMNLQLNLVLSDITGSPKAITATAHKLARILYHMLKNRQSFIEAGQDEYERQYRERVLANYQIKQGKWDMN